ncbi:MAG: transporter, family, lysophospholipid transporter [Gammaproteobacteria bacterium]|jgi:LPLT family lysophospholipid transporter-like MFS transporter|nr:transporter, family, lysophospholipid transporter [Gammaproteobacteria bacterium]
MGPLMSANKQRRSKRASRKFIPAGLWSRGMFATLGAQFLSAFGDNALLFVAVALVRQENYPAWSGPILQQFFVGAYILLAPFVGVFADARPKGRVMLYANTLKFGGALGMCAHVNPFLSYALVGAGAAANSPAKYGILSELVAPAQLVKANGLLEASTIAAILLGAIAGGTLADWSVEGSLMAITGCYAASALSAVLIPRIKLRNVPVPTYSVVSSVKAFALQTHALLKNPNARLAVIGTALFWGAGAALRFLVIAWVPVALKVNNNSLPGFLTGMVAAGIVVGAALAARLVRLKQVNRALPAGILIGVGVCLLPLVTTLPLAFTLMAFVGVCSGFFVVPLDALLQTEGAHVVGAGSAIAIQNMFENLSMLALVSGYAAAVFLSVPVNDIAVGVGIFIALSMLVLTLARRRSAKVAR